MCCSGAGNERNPELVCNPRRRIFVNGARHIRHPLHDGLAMELMLYRNEVLT
jgi:hypothetical protein